MYLPSVHVSSWYPSSQPFLQVPLTWWQGSLWKQFPQSSVQCCPNVPLLHSNTNKKTYRTIINLVNPCLSFKSNNYIINPQFTYMLNVIDLLKLNCQSVISPDKKVPCHWKICCKIAMQLTFCTVQTLIAWSTAIQTCAIYMMASLPFQALPTRHFTFLSKCTTITRCNYMNSKTGN